MRFIPPKVTSTCNILNHTPIDCISHLALIVFYYHLCSRRMLKNGSPSMGANMAPQGGLFRTQQRRDDNSESSDTSSQTATDKDNQLGKHMNQYNLAHGYSYLPLQQPLPGAPQFYQHSPFNMTPSSQPTTIASQGFPNYGPRWECNDLHQGDYGGSQMVSPPQIPRHGPSSPGWLRVPPRPPGKNPVHWPTSSSSNPPPEPSSGAPGRPPHHTPKEMIPAASRASVHKCPRDCRLAPIARVSKWWIWCCSWEWWFFVLVWYRR